MIKAKIPQAEVTGYTGRARSFEVTVNDTLIFSKVERGAFPNFDEVVEVVISADGGGSLKRVEKVEKSCTIM
uniref:Selenoprotein W2a n=2 Tax=Eriocheir sinensis TaxID=95602 RepID=F4YIN2_ERISI|nr:selenoprotein W2a [Eriocheir sinensis]